MQNQVLQAVKELSHQMNEIAERQEEEFKKLKGEIHGLKEEVKELKAEVSEMNKMEMRLNTKIEYEMKFIHKSMETLSKSNLDNVVEIELLKSHVYAENK